MHSDRESLGFDHSSPGAEGGANPGKRTRTMGLPGFRPGGAAGGEAAHDDAGARAGGAAPDDPFFFAEGGREGGGSGNVDPGAMHAMYYGINPRPHSEKAYQRGDSAPPLAAGATCVGKTGTVVVLATTIYNRPPFGRVANFSVCDRGGAVLHAGSVAMPGQVTINGLPPGSAVYIRPETMGTMCKILTPEQIAAGGDDQEQQKEGAGGHGHGHGHGEAEAGGGAGNLDAGTMQSLYYGINPPRHAEKAYQPGDTAPPLHPRPTTVGKSGQIVALATTIYNKPPFGRVARFSLVDRNSGRVLHTGAVATPGQQTFDGMAPGTQVLIRPETMGTMVKLLTPEQIAGATEHGAEE